MASWTSSRPSPRPAAGWTAPDAPAAPSASCRRWATCTPATCRSSTPRSRRDLTIVSVFVNPLQFGPARTSPPIRATSTATSRWPARPAPISSSPRPVEEMYPAPIAHRRVGGCDQRADGGRGPAQPLRRGGHRRGQAVLDRRTVPRLLRGEGLPAAAVVTRMASTCRSRSRSCGCPTVREPDGLALSSRNAYLTAEERAAAPVLQRALRAGAEAIEGGGERDAATVRRLMTEMIEAEPTARLDYAEVVVGDDAAPGRPARGRAPAARRRPLRPRPADRQRRGHGCRSLDLDLLGARQRRGRAVRGRAGRRGPRHAGRACSPRASSHQATTRWAQGGVAAVLGGADPDSTDLHLADTLAAGGGLCDRRRRAGAGRRGPGPGPRADRPRRHVRRRRPTDALARRGRAGTRCARVVHAGGAATGAEIERALVDGGQRDGRGRATSTPSPST